MAKLIFYALFAILFIHGFYKIYKVRWPKTYFALADQLSYFISVSPLRYIAFRFLPILLIVSVVNAAIGDYYDNQVMLLLSIIICSVHAFMTNGLELFDLMNKRKQAQFENDPVEIRFGLASHIIFNMVSIVILMGVGWLAAEIGKQPWVKIITPSFSGMIDNLWGTAVVTLVGVMIFDTHQKRKKYLDQSDIIEFSKNKINHKLRMEIKKAAKEYQADENLVLAVCIIENLQRPAWFRTGEKIKSLFFHQGSYGIMQVQSDKYVNDKRSVWIATQKFFAGTAKMKIDLKSLPIVLKPYNEGRDYVNMVWSAYELEIRKSNNES